MASDMDLNHHDGRTSDVLETGQNAKRQEMPERLHLFCEYLAHNR